MTSRSLVFGSLLSLALVASFAIGCGDADESDDTSSTADSSTPKQDSGAIGDDSTDGSTASDTGTGGSDATTDAGELADTGIPVAPFTLNLNGSVNAMVHAGNSWYLGGEFTAINTIPAPRLLPLTPAGARVAGCDLGTGFTGNVSAVLRVGSSIFVGGNFVQYKGQVVNRIAKLDATTCALDTTFSPPAGNGFNDVVLAFATSGTSLYVGGAFTAYRGIANSANKLAKLDLTTGAIDTTFSPVGANANGFESTVYALAVSGSSLYVGGAFNAYRGVYYNAMSLAKLDLTNGALDGTFSPNGLGNNGFNSTVNALAVSGSSLYVGGNFTTYKNVANSAFRLAKLNLTSGALDTTFSPPGANANGFNTTVYTLAASGTALYVGGGFTAYRGVANSALGLAKLDLTSGAPDATFTPSGSDGFSAVTGLALVGSDVVVGGTFSTFKGAALSFVAKLNGTTGVADPAFGGTGGTLRGVDGPVNTVVSDGTTVWLGGSFRHYGGNSANHIAKVDDITYALDTTFSPAVNGFNSGVYALVASGNSLYVGGDFDNYRGVVGAAHRIAKLDRTTGALDATFSPATNGFDDTVDALAIAGNSVYVGGGFTAYRGVAGSANYLAKLDATSGALDTTFSPATNGFDGWVYTLAASGTSLYVGGGFNAYRGASNIQNLAKLDLTTGLLDTTFSPSGMGNNGVNGAVLALALSGDTLFLGGDFSAYRGVANSAYNLAKVNATSGALDTTFTMAGAGGGFDNQVNALAVSGTSLFVGGGFRAYRGVGDSANYLAKVDTTSGAIDTAFSPVGATANGFNDYVYALVPFGGSVFAGGDFSAYRGTTPANFSAKLDTTNGTMQ